MPSAVLLPLQADRDLWFVSDPIVFTEEDWTGGTFRMQVRLEPDMPGSPLASLATVTTAVQGVQLTYAGSDTVANHIAAGRMTAQDASTLGYATTDTLTLSIVVLRINSTTMSAMPAAPETGDDLTLYYDLLATVAPLPEQKRLYGPFVVKGTVTQ